MFLESDDREGRISSSASAEEKQTSRSIIAANKTPVGSGPVTKRAREAQPVGSYAWGRGTDRRFRSSISPKKAPATTATVGMKIMMPLRMYGIAPV
jgi:hypothetical protein